MLVNLVVRRKRFVGLSILLHSLCFRPNCSIFGADKLTQLVAEYSGFTMVEVSTSGRIWTSFLLRKRTKFSFPYLLYVTFLSLSLAALLTHTFPLTCLIPFLSSTTYSFFSSHLSYQKFGVRKLLLTWQPWMVYCKNIFDLESLHPRQNFSRFTAHSDEIFFLVTKGLKSCCLFKIYKYSTGLDPGPVFFPDPTKKIPIRDTFYCNNALYCFHQIIALVHLSIQITIHR